MHTQGNVRVIVLVRYMPDDCRGEVYGGKSRGNIRMLAFYCQEKGEAMENTLESYYGGF